MMWLTWPTSDQRQALQPAMNGDQVHAVERDIDKARQPPLDRHAPADQIAHQRAHGGEMAQRHQRAVIVIDEIAAAACPRSWRVILWKAIAAIWCAAWARGGTGRVSPSGTNQAQSPMAKMRSSRVVCKRGLHHQLVAARGFQPQVRQHVRALHARRPDPQVGFDQLARLGDHAFGGGFHHLLAGDHPHAQRFQLLVRRLGQLFRQRRQDARPRLDQGHFQPAFVEHFQPVMAQLGGGIVKLGRQFHAGGAAADNIHPHHRIGVRDPGCRVRDTRRQ